MTDSISSPQPNFPNHPPSLGTKKLFYGWWIVLASTLVLFVSSGIGFYGHGVILDPMRTLHGWSKATISSAVTLYFLTSGITGLIIGRQIDRYGPKWFLIMGSLTIGIGFVILSQINAVWQLYTIYFLMALGFSCTALVPANTLITNWFIRKRGFAMSLANTGLSVGGIVLVPFASYIIARWGLEISLPVLGIIYAVTVICATAFIIQRPSDINQFPDGTPPEAMSEDRISSGLNYATQMRAWTRLQAIRTVAFWSIVISFLLALSG